MRFSLLFLRYVFNRTRTSTHTSLRFYLSPWGEVLSLLKHHGSDYRPWCVRSKLRGEPQRTEDAATPALALTNSGPAKPAWLARPPREGTRRPETAQLRQPPAIDYCAAKLRYFSQLLPSSEKNLSKINYYRPLRGIYGTSCLGFCASRCILRLPLSTCQPCAPWHHAATMIGVVSQSSAASQRGEP